MNISKYRDLVGERLRRQRLLMPLTNADDEQQYMDLFRLLQPVAPVHNTVPGDPPKLVHRTIFEDRELSSELRERNVMVKGRFCGGRVGYVLLEDLERYAIAFRKPLTKFNKIHEDIIELIKTSGGLSKEQLKEELADYPNREITKALQSLHEAFIVYEQQTDADWDTGWFDFSTEWFEINTDEHKKLEAVSDVLHTFIKAMVFASFANMKSWSQLPIKIIRLAIESLINQGKIVKLEWPGESEYYICIEDLQQSYTNEYPATVFMLDRSDMLVRAYIDELTKQYKGYEVLQYLLIDGEFKGAVLGHWGFGPYDIEDIIIDLPSDQLEARRKEILASVTKIYSPEHHPIRKYNGTIVERD